MEGIDVTVIIINYNTPELTLESIKSVLTYTSEIQFEIIVIDNASTDNSVKKIEKAYSDDVILIVNEVNVGFGRANNQGIEIAKGEFIFLLNSDAFLTSNALLEFVNFMRHPDNATVAFCGAELYTGSMGTIVSYGNFPTLLEAFSSIGFYLLYKEYYLTHISAGVTNTNQTIRQVEYINGADMFIRKTCLEQHGAFDKDFFLYFEETELAYRLTRKGHSSYILPYVKIIHLGNGSQQTRKKFNYVNFGHYCKGRDLYFKKCHGSFYSFLVRVCFALREIIISVSGKQNGNIFKKMKLILFPA